MRGKQQLAQAAAESYRYCQKRTRESASSFYWSFWMLPAEKRRAMCALYAFARHTDDLCDSDQPLAHRRLQVEQWRDDLDAALQDDYRHPLLPSLMHCVRRYEIPPRHLFEVIDGVAMDLEYRRYETFEHLQSYCYRVASSVGLCCMHIWGCQGDEVWQPAADCGVAFQLTNILRDLREDAARDRIYLPLEDLRRFHYEPQDLLAGVVDDRFRALMRFEIERTRQFFQQAELLLRYLRGDGRRIFLVMFKTYGSLLDLINRRSGEVFHRRLRLGFGRKLAIAALPWFGGPARVAAS